jgi:hypothetical protein
MTPLHLLVRVVHALLGAFWAGSAFLMAYFLLPAVEETGSSGGAVMEALTRRNMIRVLIWMGVFTVLTGIYLLWGMSGHFTGPFMGTEAGILLSTGGLFGILALLVAVHVSRPTARKLVALGAKVAASGAPPTPEEVAEMTRLRGKLKFAARLVAVLLAVTLVCMALGPHV